MTETPLSILIIDDKPAEIRLLVDTLEDYGFDLIVALNGEDGLSSAANSRPDLILLDLVMPVPNGFEVCHQLKQNPATQAIQVIIITAMHDVRSVVQAFRLGASDYITKPIEIAEVLSRVTLHLDPARLEMRLYQRLAAYRHHSSQVPATLEVVQADLQGIERVKRYLLTHLDCTVSLEELAGIAHSNRTSLCENFRVLHGMSVFEWLREQRMQTAARLLTASSLQVRDIALQSGYADIASFSKAFKRRFGISPLEYRKTGMCHHTDFEENPI